MSGYPNGATECVQPSSKTLMTYPNKMHFVWHLCPKQELPPYYQPWMDIAQRVPELVEAHELRSQIKKVSGLHELTKRVHRVYGAVAQCSIRADASTEHQVPAETQGASTSPPSPRCHDHGICLAGG